MAILYPDSISSVDPDSESGNNIFCCNFFQFLVIKIVAQDRIGISPKMLDPESLNPDPKHCSYRNTFGTSSESLSRNPLLGAFAAFGMPPQTDKIVPEAA